MSSVDAMVYLKYLCREPKTGKILSEGRVCPFEKEARDKLFKDAGLTGEIAEKMATQVGTAYVFEPPLEIKGGLIVEFCD